MAADSRSRRLAAETFERERGVDQAPIEENPSRMAHGGRVVVARDGDGSARERNRVHPGQRRTVAVQFLSDDPPPRLFDRGKAAPRELHEKRGLAAARAA
jgi:hypothetical protein